MRAMSDFDVSSSDEEEHMKIYLEERRQRAWETKRGAVVPTLMAVVLCVLFLLTCMGGIASIVKLATESSPSLSRQTNTSCLPSSGRADECSVPFPDLSRVTEMSVAMTACGEHLREDAILNVKSWMLHRVPGLTLHFYLLLDHTPPLAEQKAAFQAVFALWPAEDRGEGFTVTYLDATELPPQLQAHINMFKHCSAVRLFIAHLLPAGMDRVVYVDVDTLAVGDVRRLWAEFETHAPETVFGAAWEANGVSGRSWYQETDRGFPHPAPWGVNAGVLLIHLGRMRALGRGPPIWDKRVVSAIAQYGPHLQLGDQDVLNALFAADPSLWRAMPCGFNWRPGCFADPLGAPRGMTIVHGSNNFLHDGERLGNGRVNHMAGIRTWYRNFWLWPSSNSTDNLHNPLL